MFIYVALPTTHPTVPAQADGQYAHLLTLSHIAPNARPSYESEFETSGSDVRFHLVKADRDTRGIEALDQKDVAAVGSLTGARPLLLVFHPLTLS